MGRTSIDLEWAAPFTGEVYFQDNCESATFDGDWTYKRTTANPPTGTKTGGGGNATYDNFDKADITDGWSQIDENSFGEPAYIHGGT